MIQTSTGKSRHDAAQREWIHHAPLGDFYFQMLLRATMQGIHCGLMLRIVHVLLAFVNPQYHRESRISTRKCSSIYLTAARGNRLAEIAAISVMSLSLARSEMRSR